jgi:Ca-activated chloride channel family protein
LEFNENLLQELAKDTGGKYFHAENQELLKVTYAGIDQLEKSKIKKTNYERAEDKFLPAGDSSNSFAIYEALYDTLYFP